MLDKFLSGLVWVFHIITISLIILLIFIANKQLKEEQLLKENIIKAVSIIIEESER